MQWKTFNPRDSQHSNCNNIFLFQFSGSLISAKWAVIPRFNQSVSLSVASQSYSYSSDVLLRGSCKAKVSGNLLSRSQKFQKLPTSGTESYSFQRPFCDESTKFWDSFHPPLRDSFFRPSEIISPSQWWDLSQIVFHPPFPSAMRAQSFEIIFIRPSGMSAHTRFSDSFRLPVDSLRGFAKAICKIVPVRHCRFKSLHVTYFTMYIVRVSLFDSDW